MNKWVILGQWKTIKDIHESFSWNSSLAYLTKFFKDRTLFAVCEDVNMIRSHLVMYATERESVSNIEYSYGLLYSSTNLFQWDCKDVNIWSLRERLPTICALAERYSTQIIDIFNPGRFVEIMIP